MKYLLDTHTVIWALTATKTIPPTIIEVLKDPDNEHYVSAVTFWEMAIKIWSGRLEPIGPWERAIHYVEAVGFETIPLLPEEAAASLKLAENTHFDPFDRMLIWQAISRDLTLVSGDSEFKKFKADGLRLLWT